MMAEQAQTVLDVQNVDVFYGDFQALDDVSVTLKQGEFCGLIGLNGAGKTSLIKTILNLRKPDKGAIKIYDVAHDDMRAKQHVSFLPERFEPSWFMTGIEFLRFSTTLYKDSEGYRAIEDAEFIDMAKRLALREEALQARVQTYSKGMRQKLGLLSTLMTASDFLILDEPMSGLDPLARSHVKDYLLEMKRLGKTFLISSHILADMDEICDRIVVLDQKRFQYDGTPADLKKRTNEEKLERSFLQFIEKQDAA